MVNIYQTLGLVLSAAAFLANAATIPSTEERAVRKVIPGPGMPSLESLGVTSEELYQQTTSTEAFKAMASLATQGQPSCLLGRYCTYEDALACHHYLARLGTQNCTVGRTIVIMVTAGNCRFEAVNIGGNPSTTSHCVDVAIGTSWMFAHCRVENSINGANAANGNGDLFVVINHI
ncbi:uncharacterized protein GIQ15_00226 [Arthroderma uncinatum]|uniref:uncharacterized protein n=1 Tax=Arthroderma uncinatum TaxID=74035 RepID=UPI00144A91CB|nr:uncharacterized protein GIQ15_00226 [Arthroderma uncinatum]KAF3490709.1 hypothetical protein GIQ15_00226 [Arthroderma uncinatum]